MSDGVWWPEFEQWMLAHGIDPADTAEIAWRPPSAGCNDGPQCLEVLVYKRGENGQRYAIRDDAGQLQAATETKVVPMRHLPAVEVVRYRPAG
jgi:hypothetical protein